MPYINIYQRCPYNLQTFYDILCSGFRGNISGDMSLFAPVIQEAARRTASAVK